MMRGGSCGTTPGECGGTYEFVGGINIPAKEDLGLNGLTIGDKMAEVYKPNCNVMNGSGRMKTKDRNNKTMIKKHKHKHSRTKKSKTNTKGKK
jgi:hypothetical protein